MRMILSICVFAAALALGAETNPTLIVDGFTYTNVRFGRTTPTSVTIFHSTGIATIPLEKLPPELQKQFGYDPQKAAEATRRASAAVDWILTVAKVLPEGIIARGCKTKDATILDSGLTPNSPSGTLASIPNTNCPNQVTICLVEDPKMAELAEGKQFIASAYREGSIIIEDRTLEKWVYYQPKPHSVAQQTGVADTEQVRIKVLVDGSGTIRLCDGKLWYEVNSYTAPAEPVTVNGANWRPVWKMNISDPYNQFTPSLPTLKGKKVILKKLSGRGPIQIKEQPNAENGYTLSIFLDDTAQWGADWYEVELRW